MISLELSDDQKKIQKRINRLATERLHPYSLETGTKPSTGVEIKFLKIIGEERLNAFIIPNEYGGDKLDYLSLSLVTEELSYGSVELASIFGATVHAVSAILIGGSHEQKEKLLPGLLDSEGTIASCCVTEEKGGSNTSSFSTTARQRGDAFILNGTKLPVINAGKAVFYVIWASSETGRGRAGINTFVVPAETAGLKVDAYDEVQHFLSIPTAKVLFTNVVIPKHNLLGLPGSGYLLLMQTLDLGRAFFGAVCVGLARAAIEEATRFAKERVISKRPIIRNQGISFVLADLATRLDAARLLVWRACRLMDLQMDFTRESSMAKLFASELAVDATKECLQIMGQRGYYGKSLMCKYQRQAQALQIMEGTSQIQKIIIASQL
jgi:alkylation response protein AidB-like acyl-CoA dehydrogenase